MEACAGWPLSSRDWPMVPGGTVAMTSYVRMHALGLGFVPGFV